MLKVRYEVRRGSYITLNCFGWYTWTHNMLRLTDCEWIVPGTIDITIF